MRVVPRAETHWAGARLEDCEVGTPAPAGAVTHSVVEGLTLAKVVQNCQSSNQWGKIEEQGGRWLVLFL